MTDKPKSVDEVQESVVRMLQHIRENHKDDLELELRVGKFTSENEFVSGYTHDHMDLINRLLQRLKKNTEHSDYKKTWTMEPKYLMMRCQFAKNIRKTCRPSYREEFLMKKLVGKIDIHTDRQYHLRASLIKEIQIDCNQSQYEYLKKTAPISVRYIQRASFQEVVPYIGSQDLKEIVFQYDISKVSEAAPTKKKCTEIPCTYHCELELKTKLIPIPDKKVETQQNYLIADMLISRARALLGTSHLDSEKVLRPLPPAKLLVINKDG